MAISFSKTSLRVMELIRGYNHKKYWRRREVVTNPNNHIFILLKLYYLWYIKRIDSRFGCSFVTKLNSGSKFASPPLLPHGAYGIIIGHNWNIGKNCVFYHQVTLAGGGYIGDNCLFGVGAKVLGGAKLGDNVKVGLNAIVVEDIPDNSTVVLSKPRIINR